MSKIHPAARTESFTESVIREMTRLAMEHDAINLAQGFPDFAAPEEIKQAAKDAIDADLNQYPITWGEPELRGAIAAHYERRYDMAVDPRSEEHTSELQSRQYLVCRLLLERQNNGPRCEGASSK